MKRKEFEQRAGACVLALLQKLEQEDAICERMHEIPQEQEYCARFCKNTRVKCAIRYINNYDEI